MGMIPTLPPPRRDMTDAEADEFLRQLDLWADRATHPLVKIWRWITNA